MSLLLFRFHGGHQPHRLDTLSVAAVRAVDPRHPIFRRIGALRDDGSPQASQEDHPFTSLIKEDKLPIERAIDVMCSNPADEWMNACIGRSEKHCVDPKIFNDKVVLIGLTGFGGDLHETLIGKVAGVILQANYVESLLDRRVFKPVTIWFQILLVALSLVLAFWIARRSGSLVWVLLATIALMYPISVLLRLCGYYTPVTFDITLTSIALLALFVVHFYFEHRFFSPGVNHEPKTQNP